MDHETYTPDEDNELSIHTLLFEDVERARQDLEAGDDQYRRRTLVRTIFAAIEGSTYVLKQAVLEHAVLHPHLYSPGDFAILREESYELREKGRVHTKFKQLPPIENFRFTLRLWLRMHNLNADAPDAQRFKNAWATFERMKEMRNRITHPKDLNALTISDEEVKEILNTYTVISGGPMGLILLKAFLDWLEKPKGKPMAEIWEELDEQLAQRWAAENADAS